MIWGRPVPQNRMVTVGILDRFHCWPGCARANPRGARGVWWSPFTIGRRPWPDQDYVAQGCAACGVRTRSGRLP